MVVFVKKPNELKKSSANQSPFDWLVDSRTGSNWSYGSFFPLNPTLVFLESEASVTRGVGCLYTEWAKRIPTLCFRRGVKVVSRCQIPHAPTLLWREGLSRERHRFDRFLFFLRPVVHPPLCSHPLLLPLLNPGLQLHSHYPSTSTERISATLVTST